MNFKGILPYAVLLSTFILSGCGIEGKKPISDNLYFGMNKLPMKNIARDGMRGGMLFWSDGRVTNYSNDKEAKEILAFGTGIDATAINYRDFEKSLEGHLVVSGLAGLGDYALGGNNFGGYNSLSNNNNNNNGPQNMGSSGSSTNTGDIGIATVNNLGYTNNGSVAPGPIGNNTPSLMGSYNSSSPEETLGETSQGKTETSEVPEPGMLALLGSGIVFLIGFRKLKRK